MRRRLLRTSSVAGVVGIGSFVLCSWLLPLASRYGMVHNEISALASSRLGFLQTASFIAGSIGVLLISLVLWNLIGRTGAATTGTVLLMLAAANLGVIAAFPTDVIGHPNVLVVNSRQDLVHVIATLACLACGMAGSLVFAAVFRRTPRWRRLAGWTVVLFSCAVSGIVAWVLRIGDGLVERVIVTALAGWMITVAIRACQLLGPPSPSKG
jgi:Protein of unknown function (DUF998)